MDILSTFKTTLLAACAAISLGTAAQAALIPIARTAAWETLEGTAPDGTPQSCFIRAQSSDLHWSLLIGARAGTDKVSVTLTSDILSANTVKRAMSVRIDAYPPWAAVDDQVLVSDHSLTIFIAPSQARELVHQVTAGSALQIVYGDSSTWDLDLTGTTPAWEAMMPCLKALAPAVVASLTPTQNAPVPFGATAFAPPAAPFGSTAFAPPAAAPGAQPDITEVGLLTQGGVKHVRGLAGSSTAIMFVLDSGAADVQITRKAALDLALAGELTATGRTTTFVTATGATNVQPVYLLRSLTVGERTVTNIECNVTDDGDPLLGQSFLGRLGSWSIDNAKQTLVLGAAV